MLLRIMLGVSFVVNASAKELPASNQQPAKADLKDSIKDTAKTEIDQLVEFLTKTGKDGQTPENLAPTLDLPGAMPAKGVRIKNTNCFVVYETSVDATETTGKHPLCIILLKHKVTGLDVAGQFYRISLDGRLEKAVSMRGKNDEEGHPVSGTAVEFNQDLASSEVRKDFASEMREVRAWLKQQTKIAAKTSPASTGKPANEVRASATAASAAVDRESAATPADSTPAPASPAQQ